MQADLRFELVNHDTEPYWQTVKLRDTYLRQPLGLKFSDQQLKAENTDYHLAAYQGAKLVGCLVLTPQDNGEIQMRQVVVDESLQRSGIGGLLVVESEKIAVEKGYSAMILHARIEAVPFYEKHDYNKVGEMFYEVSIPHLSMEKKLVD